MNEMTPKQVLVTIGGLVVFTVVYLLLLSIHSAAIPSWLCPSWL